MMARASSRIFSSAASTFATVRECTLPGAGLDAWYGNRGCRAGVMHVSSSSTDLKNLPRITSITYYPDTLNLNYISHPGDRIMTAEHTPRPEGWKALFANPYIIIPIKFILPLAIIPAVIAALYLTEPYERFLIISGLIAAYFVPPAGKETIIPLAIIAGYPWWLITAVIFLLDVAVSLFVVWNFDLALKIPFIGRLIESGMTFGRNYTERQPWLRRFSTIGLILFVFFPLQGTGAMNGAILGRLLGLSGRRVFGCVCTGSLASCLVFALGADVLLEIYREDPTLGIGILVGIVAAIVAAAAGWLMHKRRLRERRP
ncbi:Uncharacterized membrane protein [Methanoculleus thermophilus]|uniref:Uncharacterized membrane protein n=2 Tax=Methanoculleus thermophilus TaxID=2200 RepID=A0A1G8ZGL7_9EURY|nr:Uncharacterized membrane protein [Methanoculleus thermophilus]